MTNSFDRTSPWFDTIYVSERIRGVKIRDLIRCGHFKPLLCLTRHCNLLDVFSSDPQPLVTSQSTQVTSTGVDVDWSSVSLVLTDKNTSLFLLLLLHRPCCCDWWRCSLLFVMDCFLCFLFFYFSEKPRPLNESPAFVNSVQSLFWSVQSELNKLFWSYWQLQPVWHSKALQCRCFQTLGFDHGLPIKQWSPYFLLLLTFVISTAREPGTVTEYH